MSDRVILSSRTPSPVLVVGSVAYDNIETPKAKGERILGGSASYVSLAASFFAPTRMVGVVGRDFAASDLARLSGRGICLEGLQHDLTGDTFFWAGKYHENYNRRDTTDIRLNVFEHYKPVLPDSYRSTPFVVLGNISPSLQSHVLDQTVGKPFVIADSMDLWMEIARADLLKLLPRVDLFILNDSESEMLTGESNVFLAGPAIQKLGPKLVIIKKGEHGSILFHPEGLHFVPASPVTDLQDPTGAGDSYLGALAGVLAALGDSSHLSLKRAMSYASATASMTVEAFSTTRLESAGVSAIQARHDDLRRMVSH